MRAISEGDGHISLPPTRNLLQIERHRKVQERRQPERDQAVGQDHDHGHRVGHAEAVIERGHCALDDAHAAGQKGNLPSKTRMALPSSEGSQPASIAPSPLTPLPRIHGDRIHLADEDRLQDVGLYLLQVGHALWEACISIPDTLDEVCNGIERDLAVELLDRFARVLFDAFPLSKGSLQRDLDRLSL